MTAVPPDTRPPGDEWRAAGAGRDDGREGGPPVTDPAEFEVIFDRYFVEIHRYAASRLGRDAADDIAADTFLTAFRQRQRFDPERGTVRSWLFGIATRHMSHHRRRELREYRALTRTGLTGPDEGHADQVTDRVTAGAARAQLAGALAALRPGDRDVLLLAALAGLSHAEIAAALDIPYGTVGSRLNRVRTKLRGPLADVYHLSQKDTDHE